MALGKLRDPTTCWVKPSVDQITWLLAQQGLYVAELVPVRADLESVFLDLTAEEHLGATQDGASGGCHR